MDNKIAILDPGFLYNHIIKENEIKIVSQFLPVNIETLILQKNIEFKKINILYIDDYNISYDNKIAIVKKLNTYNFEYRSLTDFYEKYHEKAALIYDNGVLFYPFYLNEFKEKKYFSILFRLLDILFSSILLPFAFIIILIACFLLLIKSGSPLFFTQERIGKNAKVFKIYKIRTMVNSGSMAHTVSNDNRIFPLGMFFRKFKIDELPQLLNILKGDMSFFGPRPERLDLHINICNSIPIFEKRLLVSPGLTGWAQIKNPKATPNESFEKLQYDIYFIKNVSFNMLSKIVLNTIEILLKKNSN
jgi:lipopolysaccharide/colanic/teichoic acid biosynthesis glycosyltransferase